MGQDLKMPTIVEKGTGSLDGKWLVSADVGGVVTMVWIDGHFLRPVGTGFPRSLSLAACRLSRIPAVPELRHVSFPLQAVRRLIVADNVLAALPDDFASAFPALEMLDLSGNLFASFPAALQSCLWLEEVVLLRNARLCETNWLEGESIHWT